MKTLYESLNNELSELNSKGGCATKKEIEELKDMLQKSLDSGMGLRKRDEKEIVKATGIDSGNFTMQGPFNNQMNQNSQMFAQSPMFNQFSQNMNGFGFNPMMQMQIQQRLSSSDQTRYKVTPKLCQILCIPFSAGNPALNEYPNDYIFEEFLKFARTKNYLSGNYLDTSKDHDLTSLGCSSPIHVSELISKLESIELIQRVK